MRNLIAAMALAPTLLLGFMGQTGQTPAWQNPLYGKWHSSVIGGGGYLLNTVACPSDPNRMYLYGDMDGLFRSDDGGNRWRIIHANLPVQQGHYEFAGLAVDRQNADRIAVAAGDQDGPKDGVFLSDDGGKSWTKTLSVRFMGNGPFRWAGTRLAGDRGKTGRLVAASEGDGVWTSEDGGRSWTARGLEGVFFTQARVDRSDAARVWLCAQPVDISSGKLRGGFYRTEDGGKSWAKLSEESPTEVVQDPDAANVLYGLLGSKLMRSRDRGTSWQPFSNGIQAAADPKIDTAPFTLGEGPGFVLAIQRNPTCIYRLDKGSSEWKKIQPTFVKEGWRFRFFNPPASNPSSVLVSSSNPRHWFLTDEFGLYQSWDSGSTWKTTNQGIEVTVIHTLSVDPTNSMRVYMGAGDVGFWWSEDGGTVFNQTDSTSAGWLGNLKCIAISPKLPSQVYATGGEGWNANRIYSSADYAKKTAWLGNGDNGLPKGSYSCNSIVVDPSDPESVTIAISGKLDATGGVFHSADGGKHWAPLGKGLPPDHDIFTDSIWWGGKQLAIGPDGVLLAVSAACNCAFRYDASSGSWKTIPFPHNGGVYSIEADPIVAGRYYICAVGDDSHPDPGQGGVFRTDDFGATWSKILAASTRGFAVSRESNGTLAASTRDGILLSTDGGKTWNKLDPPPNRWYFNCLAFAGHRLLAGSGGNGVFWTDVP